MAERLVLCCGNPDRGDDGVGWSVAAQLRGMAVPGLRVVAMRGAAAELLDAMNGEADVVLVDAAVSGASPGTVQVIDCAADAPLPALGGASSHGFGVAEAIGLARALGCLPPRCRVYAIEAASFEPGSGLSGSVAEAALRVAETIAAG
ncbi:MAG: hydrogenase maturation protease [Rhodospirillales bacterium]|nr:hydrogenase maturation protease [Rhodospirillales bacterium]